LRNIILGVALIIIGILGALLYSTVFFGFFTVGLFLLIQKFIVKTSSAEPRPTSAPSISIVATSLKTCPNCGKEIDSKADFCAHCGNKVNNK
jgi:hypothetical protein